VLGRHFRHYTLWTKVGWIGVDLFFVLSGFLISGLLFTEYQRHGSIDFWRFILRRGLKIWPAYYLLLAVTAVFSLLVCRAQGIEFQGREIFVSAVFARNFFGKVGFSYLAHSWSLAVEEHFYFLLPVLLLLLLRVGNCRDPFRSIPSIFAFIAFASLALRYLAAAHSAAYPSATPLRMDGLFAGVFLGYLHHFHPHWFAKLTGHYALAICAVCVLPAFVFSAESLPMRTYGVSLLMIGFAFLVAWSVVRQAQGRIAKLAAKIGFYSYSIYLWHMCLAFPFVTFFKDSALAFWIALPLTITLGGAMAQLVEIPVLRLRERWTVTATARRPSAVHSRRLEPCPIS